MPTPLDGQTIQPIVLGRRRSTTAVAMRLRLRCRGCMRDFVGAATDRPPPRPGPRAAFRPDGNQGVRRRFSGPNRA